MPASEEDPGCILDDAPFLILPMQTAAQSCLYSDAELTGEQVEAAPDPRRAREVRSRSRPPEQMIRELAFDLWLKDGCQHGKAVEHWYRALGQLAEFRRQPTMIAEERASDWVRRARAFDCF